MNVLVFEMKKGKITRLYEGFLMHRIWQILKRFSRALSYAQTSFSEECEGFCWPSRAYLIIGIPKDKYCYRLVEKTTMKHQSNVLGIFTSLVIGPLVPYKEIVASKHRHSAIGNGYIIV